MCVRSGPSGPNPFKCLIQNDNNGTRPKRAVWFGLVLLVLEVVPDSSMQRCMTKDMPVAEYRLSSARIQATNFSNVSPLGECRLRKKLEMATCFKFAASIVVCIGVSACAPFVPVENVKDISPDTLTRSMQLPTFLVGQAPTFQFETVGAVDAYSCKHLIMDPPASRGDALTQLKVNAVRIGATAVMEISFDERGTDTWGTNCWESVHASGIAIRRK
jgi:hypothetical protein